MDWIRVEYWLLVGGLVLAGIIGWFVYRQPQEGP